MPFRIRKARCIGLVLPLKPEFELSFGVLHSLARIVLRVTAESNGKTFVGQGEASIDFPFSSYDSFDVLHALENAPLADLQVDERGDALEALVRASDHLARCPAAICAINQVFDDIESQVRGIPAIELYAAARPFARSMQSIGICSQPLELRDQLLIAIASQQTPKPKVGAGLARDAETIATTESLARLVGFKYLLDFNAAYSAEEFVSLVETLAGSGGLPVHAIALEQPSAVADGVEGLIRTGDALKAHGLTSPVIADESFVTADDAIRCAKAGIGLNYKIQKVGGILRALDIERQVAETVTTPPPSVVGGTFPTALGRAYDRIAARVLSSATLPADAWLPATTYFDGDRDLAAGPATEPHVVVGGTLQRPGVGIVLDEGRVAQWTVPDFRAFYACVRRGLPSDRSLIDLRGRSYADLYEQRAHRPITWNIEEGAA